MVVLPPMTDDVHDTGTLVPIKPAGSKRPLFVVHGAGGGIRFLDHLAASLDPERPLFAFRAAGLRGPEHADGSIRAMADRYVGELRAAHDGPSLLGGYSAGGLIALEMTRQLQEAGEAVQRVLLFDAYPRGTGFPGRLLRHVRLVKHGFTEGWAAVAPYARYIVRNRIDVARGAIVPEPEDALDNRDELFWATLDLLDEHPVTAHDVDAVLFKAELTWPPRPLDYLWGPYIGGKLDIRIAPGEHTSMFQPPYAPGLASLVDEVLDASDRPSPAVAAGAAHR
jgi:thioesterase domain-containing protein